MYVQYIYCSKLFPEGREQFSFSYDNGEAILFGGLITNKSNKVWRFDPANLSWSTLDFESSTVTNRSGHTANLHSKKLYIFGGKSKIQSMYMLNDLEIFDIENNTWIFPNCSCKNYLKLRRNHVSVCVGKIINKNVLEYLLIIVMFNFCIF